MVSTVKNALIMLKNIQEMFLKLLRKEQFEKKAEVTGNFIGSKITDKITKLSKTMQQNNSETVTNEHDQEIPNERYISPEER